MKIPWKAIYNKVKKNTGTCAEGQYNGSTFKFVGVFKVLFFCILKPHGKNADNVRCIIED